MTEQAEEAVGPMLDMWAFECLKQNANANARFLIHLKG
jgi:hypothetical protein